MNIQHWLILGLTSLALVSCTQGTAPTVEAPASPSAIAPESPSAIAQATEQVIKSGTFASGEHPTEGTARILDQNGSLTLSLDPDFKTSELGPDLVVILHRSANALSETQPPAYPLTEGDYVVLAPLERFSGAQRYAIPDTVNLADYSAVGIWCRKFNATFGIAALQ